MTSPPLANRAPAVDAWMSALDDPLQPAIADLRHAILASDPEITEQIKWKAPSFCIDGDDRVTFRLPPKGGFQIIFHRGVAVKDASGFSFADDTGLLTWAAADRGIVTLDDTPAIVTNTPAIVGLVSRWMAATRV